MLGLEKHKYSQLTLLSICFSAIAYLAFFTPHNDVIFLSFFLASFAAYWFLIKTEIQYLFQIGLLVRIVLLFAHVIHHQGWYLMIEAGQALENGTSPYVVTQDYLFGRIPFYPPLNQWLFFLASKFNNLAHGVFVLKLFILGGEIGVYWILNKLMNRFNMPVRKLAIYWLNPLVIFALMGTVRFEGIALFFILFSCYSFTTLKDTNAAFHFSFAVLSSISSLLFLPLLLLKAGWKRVIPVVFILLFVLFFCFLPFLSSIEIADLFNYFEIAYHQSGFSLISLLLILLISYLYRFRNRLSIFTGLLLINAVYLLFLPFIQAWSIVFLLAFAVFSKYQFPIIWSALLMLFYTPLYEIKELFWVLNILLWLSFLWEAKRYFTLKKFVAGIAG